MRITKIFLLLFYAVLFYAQPGNFPNVGISFDEEDLSKHLDLNGMYELAPDGCIYVDESSGTISIMFYYAIDTRVDYTDATIDINIGNETQTTEILELGYFSARSIDWINKTSSVLNADHSYNIDCLEHFAFYTFFLTFLLGEDFCTENDDTNLDALEVNFNINGGQYEEGLENPELNPDHCLAIEERLVINNLCCVNFDQPADVGDRSSFNLNIFPNPVVDILSIEGLENETKVYIYSIISHKRNLGLDYYIGKNNSLDLSNLSSGVYFLKTNNENCSDCVYKFVKL